MAQPSAASTMSDEELDAALAELGLGDNAPTEEEKKEEEADKKPEAPKKPEADPAEDAKKPEEEELPKPGEGKEGEEEEGKQPSRREQLRIQDLLKKYPVKEEKKPEAPAPKRESAFDYDKDLEADPALKAKLAADREAAEKAAYERGRSEGGKSIAEEKASLLFHTRLEVDAPKVESKYPVLDKDSDKFNPVLAKAINSMYLNATGYDFDSDTVTSPQIRYSDFVEALFELGDEIGTSKAEKSKKEVVKQAAQTGLRPEGGAAKPALNLNKLPSQMTDEELDAALEQMIPSK